MDPYRPVEIVLAPKEAWKIYALHGEGLGPWSGFYGIGVIQLGQDSNELNIFETLSHEFMHCLLLLWISREATDKMDSLWYKYEGKINQFQKIKELLRGLSHSGIGFPEDHAQLSEKEVITEPPWDIIIEYHEIPYFTPNAFYQFKYNKIYIHELIKNYPEYHKYVLEHEKEHYDNNNYEKGFFDKVLTDIKIEWKGFFQVLKNKQLEVEIKSHKKEKSKKEMDWESKFHYFITKNLRPDSVLINILVFLIVLFIGDAIASKIFGYNVIKFCFQLIKYRIKSMIC